MGEIFVDGPFRVMLKNSRNEDRSDRTAILYREAGSTEKIVFRTSDNIVNKDFVMTAENGWTVPTGPEYTGRMVIANDRFMVEIKTDNDGVRYFEFTALVNYDAVTVASNPSTLTVKVVDRITFDITILQRDADPNDWNNGGNIPLDW
jgi:hypothetical protein